MGVQGMHPLDRTFPGVYNFVTNKKAKKEEEI